MIHNQKDEFEKITAGNVLDSLKENISEASPYLNYIKQFFGRKPSLPISSTPTTAPVAAPINEEEYIRRLDKILDDSQNMLNQFVSNLELRIVKRNMSSISFLHPQIKKKIKKDEKRPIQITNPAPDFSKIVPPKNKSPINTIFEGDIRAWKKRSEDLEKLMQIFSHNIETYLQSISKDIGYAPMKKDLVGLIQEFNKFPNLTSNTKRRIKVRLQHFLFVYDQLSSWLNLFKTTENRIEKAMKNHKPF